MDTDILEELGFSEREIKVFVALLELGMTKVGPIAAKTKMQHSKVYQTLEKLIEKGLVNYVFISKTKHFQTSEPKEILNILEERKRRFQELLLELEQKRKFAKEKQTAVVYEGYKAIKTMFNTIIDNLKTGDQYWVFAFKEEYKISPEAALFLRNVHMRLAEKHIDDRLIAHKSVQKEFLETYKSIKNLKCQFVDFEIPLGLMIIGNKVINWTWGERPTAIEITSKQIAEQYRKFFLAMWETVKS